MQDELKFANKFSISQVDFMFYFSIMKMQAAQNNRPNRIIPCPPLPPTTKTNANYLSPYLTRTNSISKSFKKNSVEKSIKQREFQQQIKYAVPNKIQASFQRSLVQSEKNVNPILFHSSFQDTTLTLNQTKSYSKQKKQERQESREKVNTAKPFDVLSVANELNEEKNRDKNNEYYLYWKSKAHQYLDSNMKLMEDVRRLTRQNEQLKQFIQKLDLSTKSAIKPQVKNSEIMKQTLKREQNRQNSYLIEKLEQMQRELKKREIVIKSYQQKIIQLNSKLIGDNQRTRLITKLKSEIDNLKNQLKHQQTVSKRDYDFGSKGSIQKQSKTKNMRQESKFSDFQRK